MECSICAERFNGSTRKSLTCQVCQLNACKSCIRAYCDSNHAKAKCMGMLNGAPCTNVYGTSFLVSQLSRSWYNTAYKPKLKQLLWEEEEAKMPGTLVYVEQERHVREVKQRMKMLDDQMRVLADQIRALQYNLSDLRMRKHDVSMECSQGPVTPKEYIMPCPFDCKGFLSTKYKCGLCEKRACADCMEVWSSDHVCDDGLKATTQLIRLESKPCPKCGTRICKVSGCDQMYCTNIQDGVHCNTAFSWRTGRLETGAVHNPHYYELMQKTGVTFRVAGDIRCGGLVPFPVHVVRTVCPSLRDDLRHVHQNIAELVQYVCQDAARRLQCFDDRLRMLRVYYLMGELEKDDFKTKVLQTNMDHDKTGDVYHVHDLMGQCAMDAFSNIQTLTTEDEVRESLAHMNRVREYCNEELAKLSVQHQCTVKIFDDAFGLVSAQFNMNGEMSSQYKRLKT